MLAVVQPAAAQPALTAGDSIFLPSGGPISGSPTSGSLTTADRQPRLGGGYDLFDGPFGPAGGVGVPQPGWTLTPSIGLQFLGTDNINNATTRQRSEFVTGITPGATVTANTATVTGLVNYTPTARFYANEPDQNRLDHRFSAFALATLIPETLFFDLRGFGGLSETSGGSAPVGSPVIVRGNQVQTISLQASPYLRHRFGSYATAQAGYNWRYVSQDGRATALPGTAQPFFTSQETTSHEGYAVARTGDYFGRLALEARVLGTVYDSNGVLDGAHRYQGVVQARYALTREVAAVVEGGYEDQKYGGTSPFTVQAPIWSVGVRLAPDPDSVLILRYGQRDGFTSAFVQGGIGIGTRTRLSVSYVDQLGTTAQRTADLLTTTAIDALGNPVDTSAGVPSAAVPYTNSFLATQSSLFRLKRGTVTLSQNWDRDTVGLSLLLDERRPITSAIGTTGFSQKGTSVGLSWTRSLTPVLFATTYLQYGISDTTSATGPSFTSDVYTARLSLTQFFSETLSGNLLYSFSNRGNDVVSDRAAQNIIIVGLRKTF